MSDQSRSCPKCHEAMDFRLGEFDCPNCGHTESAAKPKAQSKGSGPGFRSEQQWGGSTGKPNVPPRVAPPATGTVYSPEESHTFGKEESRSPKPHSSLQTEKHVYFGITVLGSLVNVLSSTFSHGLGWSVMGILENLFWAFIGLAVLAFVFFGSELWAKQCCMWWTVFQIVLVLGSFIFVSSLLNRAQIGGFPGAGLLGSGLAIYAAAISIAWEAWLIWILYRDSQDLS